MDRGSKPIFSHRRHMYSQWAHEKMLNITNYYKNANQKRYPLKLVRMAIIEKTRSNKYWQECGEKRTLVHSLWDYKLVQSLWKNSMMIPPKS